MTDKEQFQIENFVVFRNAISQSILNFVLPSFYDIIQHTTPKNDTQVNNCYFGNTAAGHVIGHYLKPFVESIVSKKLNFTYDYFRAYLNQNELKKHTDRESCEYSLTICLKKGNCNYPIFFEKKDGSNVKIELENGDMILYKGMELCHWREKYQGDQHIQLFIHYVDINNRFSVYKNDNIINNISSYS